MTRPSSLRSWLAAASYYVVVSWAVPASAQAPSGADVDANVGQAAMDAGVAGAASLDAGVPPSPSRDAGPGQMVSPDAGMAPPASPDAGAGAHESTSPGGNLGGFTPPERQGGGQGVQPGASTSGEGPSDASGTGTEHVHAIEQLDLAALLREPIVTASGGVVQERALAPANVFVVTRDEIALHGWRTLADVLASVPGLYIIDDHVMPSVGVRGVTGGLRAGTRIIKVMINGVPVNFRPDLTAMIGPEFIPIEAVDRVEIVEGPLSSLYGANAFIATVNVITRKPDQSSAEIAGRGTVINGNLGGGGSVYVSRSAGNVGVLGAFSLDWTDRSGLAIQHTFPGQDPSSDQYRSLFAGPSQGDITTPQSLFLLLNAGDPGDRIGQLTVQGGLQRLDAMGEFQVNSAMSHRSRYAIDNFWSSAELEHKWSDALRGSVTAGFAAGGPTRDYRIFLAGDDNASYQPLFGYRSVQAAAQLNWTPVPQRLSLRFGLDGELDFESILRYRETFLLPFGNRVPGDTLMLADATESGTQLIGDGGLDLQVTSTPFGDALPNLQLTGNLRGDVLRYGSIAFPLQPSFRVGIVYKWSDAVVTKLVGGRAFQTPSGVQMFADPGFGRANNVIGNAHLTPLGYPALRPQTVTGAEAIVSLRLFDGGLEADAGLYAQELGDPIRFQRVATDFVAVNEQAEQNVGAVASVRAHVGRFSGYATVSLQRQIAGGKLIGDPSAQYPNEFGTAGVTLGIPEARLRLNADLRWASARGATQSNVLLNNQAFYTLPAYAELDLTASTKDLHLMGDDKSETRILFSVRNVLDQRYSEPGFGGFDVPMLGRTFLLELRQTFR